MERIVVGRSATLTKTFSFTPTGTPTVVVTRSDGTTVTTGSVSGAGASWTYTIPSSSVTQLDTLTETWTATSGGSPQTFTDYIEVAGGVLFTIAELTAIKPATKTWTDAQMADMRTLVEQAMEAKAAVAFVPRYELETVSGVGSTQLRLKWPKITAIRSVTVGGVAVTPTDVVGLSEGWAYYSSQWTAGYGNVVIGYEHGYRTPPARISRAALFEARYRLNAADTPTDDRMITQSFEGGGTTMLQQPGRGGMSFYLPETDAAVDEYSLAVGVA